MATFSQNQVKDIMVTTALAAETTIQTFIALADPLELQVLNESGSAQPLAGESFYFVQKHADGSFKKSDVLPAGQIRSILPIGVKVPVLKSYTVAAPLAVAAGDTYKVSIVINNWGSLSFEDQYFKYGVYRAIAGDTNVEVAAGLAASLTQNFSREPGDPLFTFAANAGVLTITEAAQPYITGKKQGRNLEFVVSNDFGGVQVLTNRVINPGSGRNVRDLEYFCKGNVGDSYREAGYPHNFEQWYDSNLATEYNLMHFKFYFEGPGHAVQKSEKELIVAFAVGADAADPAAGANALRAILATATGLTIPAFPVPETTTEAPTTEAPTTTVG